MKVLSALEFASKLGGGGLKAPILVTGMLRNSEEDEGVFLFLPDASFTGDWIEVPHESVETVEWIGSAKAGAEPVAHVRLALKEPATREAAVFAELLQQLGGCASCMHRLLGSRDVPDPRGAALGRRAADDAATTQLYRSSGLALNAPLTSKGWPLGADITSGNCTLYGYSTLTFFSDGGVWLVAYCSTWRSFTGDYWNATFAVLDIQGRTLLTLSDRGPRMMPNEPPRRWDKHWDISPSYYESIGGWRIESCDC